MPEKTENRDTIFCDVESISRAEYNTAQQNGLRPQYKFTIKYLEYSGQNVVEYDGDKYAVYRTFRPSLDDIELYVEQREGI
jgi:SPP1 family predicted phage head-tail adaptor